MVITENTAKFAGGRHLTKRWVEKFIPQDTRSGDEIAIDIIQRAGLTAVGR